MNRRIALKSIKICKSDIEDLEQVLHIREIIMGTKSVIFRFSRKGEKNEVRRNRV
jgi:hypothetical protein